MDKPITTYNTGDDLLQALQEVGVSYLFCNLGSDHPSIIEALARAKADNNPLPEAIICPHEYVALSAAQGYFLASGEMQGVFVHTDVGTQNLGGSLHNVARSRIPVFIFSGETPSTMYGELPGSRNAHINYLQNVYDQRGIVRSYVKWEYDIRTGKNVKDLVYRANQLANSEPKGPVYLTGTREVLAEEVQPSQDHSKNWQPFEKGSLSLMNVQEIVDALAEATNPLIITSYLGRNEESVELLIQLCEKLTIPVIEPSAAYMNFPSTHPLHQGFQAGKLLSKADVILVIDSDAPWLPGQSQLNEQAKVFVIDVDPIKQDIPLWNIPAQKFYEVDSYQSLVLMNDYAKTIDLNKTVHIDRRNTLEQLKKQQQEGKTSITCPEDGVITSEWLAFCLNEAIDNETIVLNEALTNSATVTQHLEREIPGTLFVNGGTSLGWSGGGAIGAKLAQPDKTVVNLIGDGSYLFSVPSTVYWMARRYNAPILTVIFNNQGWNATKQNALKIYPDGIANRDDRFWVNFEQPADLSKIAEAAGGACAIQVSDPKLLLDALQKGLAAVRSGQSAVIDVKLSPISNQKD
ncbi:thiamine pyrophosphate-requiring protein [Bacillus sp. Marseille-P3661]|uniref:thiamine pyrophosphate-requiring protein n=1 Tax=Bacillus sp. Marseille-P3661 TaxID=1936234 RepID=UPI002155C396|nr:thiamine pyrophosphate-requiring protein [Bacillus sp. Marseille-P3661]